MELPPRTRRIHRDRPEGLVPDGTTSAYAENTQTRMRPGGSIRNYLRVRGEYWFVSRPANTTQELPPRTRRIRFSGIPQLWGTGTTSAYAENTRQIFRHPWCGRNYLRVRGEYWALTKPLWRLMELPPRTRRIPRIQGEPTPIRGTTSAYAENTDPEHHSY